MNQNLPSRRKEPRIMESMRHFEELQRQNWNHLSTQQNSDYVGWPVSELREQHVPS